MPYVWVKKRKETKKIELRGSVPLSWKRVLIETTKKESKYVVSSCILQLKLKWLNKEKNLVVGMQLPFRRKFMKGEIDCNLTLETRNRPKRSKYP